MKVIRDINKKVFQLSADYNLIDESVCLFNLIFFRVFSYRLHFIANLRDEHLKDLRKTLKTDSFIVLRMVMKTLDNQNELFRRSIQPMNKAKEIVSPFQDVLDHILQSFLDHYGYQGMSEPDSLKHYLKQTMS